jgi:putative flippase GtrA
MKGLLLQFIKFFGISGIGWCLDFSVYIFLTQKLNWPVFQSNYISSILAVSLVFYVSTRKIFKESTSKISIRSKYLIYLTYQILLLSLVSILGQYLSTYLGMLGLYSNITKILAKIIITPITMIINFVVMKIMVEKL